MRYGQRVIFIAVLLSMVCVPHSVTAQQSLYLVRHAEKAEGSNPSLTDVGRNRALALAAFLKDKGIKSVYSSAYKRTIETAGPTAEQNGLPVQYYDPRDLPSLVAVLRASSESALVVGHSNTTPRLFNLLTGLDLPDLKEHQYDRVYIIDVSKGAVTGHSIQYLAPRTP